MMVAHLPVRLVSSAALRVAGVKAVSVVTSGPKPGPGWSVVLQAAMPPGATGNAAPPANAALPAQLVPAPPVPAKLAISLTLIEGGALPVVVFEAPARSVRAVRLTVWPGVIKQEQHEISSSFGSIV